MKFGEIPVVVLPAKGEFVLPKDVDIMYLVAGNGSYVLKNLGISTSLTKIDCIDHLPELKPFGELNIPRIPKEFLASSLKFFKQIYETYKSEAGIRIFYNPYTQWYLLDVPKQKISGASVDWENSNPPEDFMYIGTLHSHVTMSAFHSGTDKGSEGKLDGIHVVFGHVNTDEPSVTAAIVINGNRFQLNEESILKHLDINITRREEVKYVSSGAVWEDYAASKVCSHNVADVTAQSTATKFHFNLDLDMEQVEVPEEWYENMIYTPDVVYRFVDGKLVRCSSYSGNQNTSSTTKYLPAPTSTAEKHNYSPVSPIASPSCYSGDDTDYYPLPDYTICPKCQYREIAIQAMEQGYVDSLLLTTVGCYGEHTPNRDHEYEISYDGNGNMVDVDGTILMTREELEAYEAD